MTLMVEVYRYCNERNVRLALIGAAALSAHGVARATSDNDFMTTDRAVLARSFWQDLLEAAVEVRKGDFDDPLAGVVRITRDSEIPLDVVVGRYKVQTAIVERADLHIVGDDSIAIVNRVDLILLKLFAGGPIDKWDIQALLDSDPTLAARVDERVHDRPQDARDLWRQFR